MKNLLISLIVSALVLTLSASKASAEPTEQNVTRVVVKNMKSGYLLADIAFDGPITLRRKACEDDRKRDCLYEVKGRTERKLYDFNPDWAMVAYTYEAKIEVVAR